MKIFRKALLTIIVLSAVISVCAGIAEKASGAVFPDLTEDSLFYPHIRRLFQEHFVSGDTRSGTFRPSDTINRAEFAKITAYTRLAEECGAADNWSSKDSLSMAFEIFDLLKPYFGCTEGACTGIGGVPFTDVKESDPKCMDDIGNPDACEPWFSRYVYYAVSKGYIKGYADPDGTRSYRPTQNILRIHALKMMITDNGNILPESDSRYQRLLKQAVSLGSYTPKCLKGAENYIKDLNGGNTADAEKLLKYALLADRLDLFGNRCEVLGSAGTPAERAHFLQRPLTRGETPRYFAITTAYSPVRPDTADATINTAAGNSNSPAGVPSYKMPVYEKTPLYNRQGGDESVWGDNGDTGAPAPELPPAQKPVTQAVPKRPVYDPEAPYTPLTDSVRPPENIKKAIAKTGQEAVLPEKGLPSAVITASTDIALTGEYGEPCGSIPAGTKFSLLIARKGGDGEFYQYTDYNKDLICRFPCDKLMTPACRDAVAEDNALNPSQGNTVVRREEVATPDISTYFRIIKLPVENVCNVCTDTVKQVKDIKDNPAKYVKMIEDKTKAASIADGSYDIADISPAWIKAENPGTQAFTVRVKNAGGKEWKQETTFLTPDTVWLAARNMERRTRGFSRNEDIPGLILSNTKFRFTEKKILPGETATFIIDVPPYQPARAQIRLMLNGKSASNIDAVYLTAVKEEIRGFRTSADSTWLQQFPVLKMGKVKNKKGELEDKPIAPTWTEISDPDTPITVLGHAVIGEYVDTYKTYMWYPAEYNGNRGFVVASSVHAEKINGKAMDTYYKNTNQLWSDISWPREKTNYIIKTACNDYDKVGSTVTVDPGRAKVKGIILHFTAGNSENSAKAEKDAFIVEASAHFVVDKSGSVAEAAPDFLAAGHSGYRESMKCIRKDGNAFTIGIEIPNWGIAQFNKNDNKYYAHNNTTEITDVKNVEWKPGNMCSEVKNELVAGKMDINSEEVIDCKTEVWKVWNNKDNLAWGGEFNNTSYETWQAFGDQQYSGLSSLIHYLEERYDIPNKFFYGGEAASGNVGLYFFPNDAESRKIYNEKLDDFYGIYGHHNVTGKYDPGPQFDITKLNNY